MHGVCGCRLPARGPGAPWGQGGVPGEVEQHPGEAGSATCQSVVIVCPPPLLRSPSAALPPRPGRRTASARGEEDASRWFCRRCVPRDSTRQPGTWHLRSPPGKGLLAVDTFLKLKEFGKPRDLQLCPGFPERVSHGFPWDVPLRCCLLAPLPPGAAGLSTC